ncbi:NAD(+)/NADH kinase [Oceanivirga salmonicida]|uniref:NAD(+)/NADH kinase n=1 Tax=Oceanivirga salmonicida TaxID=1769291 RepID=UPI000829CF87|nr:NAD(+)/NADH kinase [Oceanivirga salmonicida]
MKVFIVKKDNIDISNEIKMLNENSIEIVKENPDYIFSFGGDGTILKALKYAIKYNKPIIPINYGKIGYMADIEVHEFLEVIKAIKNKEYILSKRYLLNCKILDNEYYALNDIVFKNNFLDEIYLYDKEKLVTKYRADGLIISTPTGSTAYAMSAGGSIIHPELKLLNIVAIASQYLGTRSLILPNIKLNVSSNSDIYIDGLKIDEKKEVYVELSDKYVEILELKTKNYYNILKTKLEWR